MNDSKHGNLLKHKRHTAAKIFHKHLEEIDSKCNLELDKLQEIKKGIDVIRISFVFLINEIIYFLNK